MEELKLTEEEIKEGAGLAALSYIFFLWILTFIFKKENRFAHYHARQGLVIFIGEAVCIFLPFLPLLGILGVFLYKLGMTLFLILSLYGIYSSLTGKLCRIPGVTNIASKLVI
jgi:uncharacterized membrane protein